MNHPQAIAAAPPASSYGFHCVLQPQSFAHGVAREEPDGRLVVGFMDPVAVMQMTSNPEVARVAHEVRERLERVRSALGGSTC